MVEMPVVGESIYIPSTYFIGHGEDDIEGGLATIARVDIQECSNPYNTVFVAVKEAQGHVYNWQYLLSNQDKWRDKYAGKIAHNDPDFTFDKHGNYYEVM